MKTPPIEIGRKVTALNINWPDADLTDERNRGRVAQIVSLDPITIELWNREDQKYGPERAVVGPDEIATHWNQAEREAQWEKAAKNRLKRWKRAKRSAYGLRLTLIKLHKPYRGTRSSDKYNLCAGCDQHSDPYEIPPWPCRTFKIVEKA